MPPKKRSQPQTATNGGDTSVVPSKMKIGELKEELEKRGLDTAGKKAELVARLEDALQSQGSRAT